MAMTEGQVYRESNGVENDVRLWRFLQVLEMATDLALNAWGYGSDPGTTLLQLRHRLTADLKSSGAPAWTARPEAEPMDYSADVTF